jgi:YCII-related domain
MRDTNRVCPAQTPANGPNKPSSNKSDSRKNRQTFVDFGLTHSTLEQKLIKLSRKGGGPMRVMVIGKATKDCEAGIMPKQKPLEDMGKCNEKLVKAGVMLAFGGLQPSSKGKRVRFSGGKRTVIDGPFTETTELIAGYSIHRSGRWKRLGIG